MNVDLQPVDLRKRVTVHQQQIRPAIVVEIEKSASPTDEARIPRDAGLHADVLKLALALIPVKRFRLIGKIGAKNREQPFVQIIRRRHPHARQSLAIIVERGAPKQSLVHELPVSLIDIKDGRRLIASYVDIGETVAIKISSKNPERVIPIRLRYSALIRYVA